MYPIPYSIYLRGTIGCYVDVYKGDVGILAKKMEATT